MARNLQYFTVSDFTGGLNLRADAFQLRSHESPDMLNVDLDPRGGFAQRDGTSLLNSTVLGSVPANIWAFSTTAGTHQVLVQQGNDAAYSTGGNFTAINPDALTLTGTMRAATLKDVNYIQRNAEQVAWRWSGSAATVLGVTFNDNIAAPNQGDMPQAKCITAWRDYMWVANTKESGTAYPSRVRFSHPNQPEDWHSLHYFDVAWGQDGDEITALVPHGDALVVFKRNSIHVITGYDAETFSVNEVTRVAGTISQESVAATDYGIYFFHWPHGVYLYTPDGRVKWVFERLHPAIEGGDIPATYQTKISLAWLRRRLWVSVPWEASTTPARVFVLDPSLGDRRKTEGGWVAFDLPLGPMLEWKVPGVACVELGCSPTVGRVLKLHQNLGTDDLGAGAVDIASTYTTRWFDDNKPAVVKRFKRPEIILDNDVLCRLQLDVWRDYDPAEVKRTAFITTDPVTGVLVWDDGSHAANMKWDDNVWAAEGEEGQTIQRVGILGRARAVRLRFTKDTASVRWSVNAITFKYIPRRVRS